MKLLLILGGVFTVVVAVLFIRRRSNDGSHVGDWALVDSGYQYGAPPNQAGNPKSPGGGLAGYCEKIYGYNSQLIGMVPDKNAKDVSKANELLSDINCGGLKLAEKAVGAVIVTPAKKLWKAIF